MTNNEYVVCEGCYEEIEKNEECEFCEEMKKQMEWMKKMMKKQFEEVFFFERKNVGGGMFEN